MDDEHAAFGLYNNEPAQRLTQPRTAASPHVLLFNASEAYGAAPERIWAQHDGAVDYFQHPALALLTRHLMGGSGDGGGGHSSGGSSNKQQQQQRPEQPFDFL